MKQEKMHLISKDGEKINTVIFHSEKEPKGILIVCHGFGEHIVRYKEFAENMAKSGYTCVVFDQCGHGEMSHIPAKDREKHLGIIPSYGRFLDDIEVIKNKVVALYPSIPLILYGHSMGGNIAANFLLKKEQDCFACAILESPWLRLFKPVAPHNVFLAKILGKLNHRWATVRKLDYDNISQDKQANSELENDPIYHNRISLRMFSGLDDAGKYAVKNGVNLKIPVLLVCADKDKIVSPAAIRDLKNKANDNVTLVSYNANHSIHCDIIKKIYFRDIIEYLDSAVKVSDKIMPGGF